MVTITNALQKKGEMKDFTLLELKGEVELMQSMQTGKFYATAKRCFIPSTFTEEEAKALIGTRLEGSIIRIESDPYDFTIRDTGEVIKIAHSYSYLPPAPVLGVERSEFTNSELKPNDFYKQCIENPFVLYTLPLHKAITILKKIKAREPIEEEMKCGEIIRQ